MIIVSGVSMRTLPQSVSKDIIGAVLLGGMAALSGCGPKALISGKVLDNFGVPLEGVSVVVEGTQFQAVTKKDGAYKIRYAPGSIKLIYSKVGYFNGELALSLATETRVPAKEVTVTKIPPGKGFYLVGKTDYEPLSPGGLTVRQSGFMGIERTYFVSGKTTPILADGRKLIIDNDLKNQVFYKIQASNAGRVMSPLVLPAVLVGPDTYLWDLSAVPNGDYAFVTHASGMMIGTVGVEPVYKVVVRAAGANEGAAGQNQSARESARAALTELISVLRQNGANEEVKLLEPALSLIDAEGTSDEMLKEGTSSWQEALAIIKEKGIAAFRRINGEGQTKGNLGAFRMALSIYYGDNGQRYPVDLRDLSRGGKYLSSIPTARTGHHPDTSSVVHSCSFPGELRDLGGWAYCNSRDGKGYGTLNVDCTHTDSKGALWHSY